MTARRVTITIVAANLIAIALAIVLGLVTAGKPSRYFGEGRFTTIISCGQLLAIGFLSGRLFLMRRHVAAPLGPVSAAWIWGLIAVGFAFLAADDAFEIHERLDRIIHEAFHMQETAWTDRLDDMIIAAYGVVGVSLLWLFREEILFFTPMRRPLGTGFLCLLASVVCDTISNDDHFLVWLLDDPATGKRLNTWFAVGDGAFTLLAEGFFLVAFYLSHRTIHKPAQVLRQGAPDGHPFAGAD